MATGTRRTGEFCWINMLTSQPDEARQFFSSLLGWTYIEMPGMGHRMQVGGRDIGAIFDLDSPMTPPGTPPGIGVMVKVESADATGEKITALGGKAQPAFDVMENGRMAVCTDPNGAAFDLWEPKSQEGTSADSTEHGATSWFETMTSDARRAREFYSALFGWTPQEMEMPGMTYTMFRLNDADVAGMLEISPEMGPIPPHWVTYFTVNNADETVSQVVELGGSVVVPAQDIPGTGRFAGLTSPQGVMFSIIQYSN